MGNKENERKMTLNLPEGEVPAFFKYLAGRFGDAVSAEGGAEGEMPDGGSEQDIDLADFSKVKISLKKKDGAVSIKVKVKAEPAIEEEADAGADTGGEEEETAEGEKPEQEDKKKDKLKISSNGGKKKDKEKSSAEDREKESGKKSEKKEYKKLKKRMKKSFKELKKAAEEGALPAEETVNEFLQDSEQMVSFEGYGDEMYDEYIRHCEQFREAFGKGEIEPFREAVLALDRIKEDSHLAFKN